MTLDEAKKIAAIAAEVDGGCSVCVSNTVVELNDAFPEFKWERQGREVIVTRTVEQQRANNAED